MVSTGSAGKTLLGLCSLPCQHVFPLKQQNLPLQLASWNFQDEQSRFSAELSGLFSLFIISAALLFITWQEFIVWDQREDHLKFLFIVAWNQIWICCQRVILSLMERMSSQTPWISYFHLNLYVTEPSRVTTSTGFFEQYFKALNF